MEMEGNIKKAKGDLESKLGNAERKIHDTFERDR